MEWHWLALLIAIAYFVVVLLATFGFILLKCRAEPAEAAESAPPAARSTAPTHPSPVPKATRWSQRVRVRASAARTGAARPTKTAGRVGSGSSSA
jgi:hypothetical protein